MGMNFYIGNKSDYSQNLKCYNIWYYVYARMLTFVDSELFRQWTILGSYKGFKIYILCFVFYEQLCSLRTVMISMHVLTKSFSLKSFLMFNKRISGENLKNLFIQDLFYFLLHCLDVLNIKP